MTSPLNTPVPSPTDHSLPSRYLNHSNSNSSNTDSCSSAFTFLDLPSPSPSATQDTTPEPAVLQLSVDDADILDGASGATDHNQSSNQTSTPPSPGLQQQSEGPESDWLEEWDRRVAEEEAEKRKERDARIDQHRKACEEYAHLKLLMLAHYQKQPPLVYPARPVDCDCDPGAFSEHCGKWWCSRLTYSEDEAKYFSISLPTGWNHPRNGGSHPPHRRRRPGKAQRARRKAAANRVSHGESEHRQHDQGVP